ncbi:AAA family ATPase [bacterium]|nr:AAA family ATPase [bacterium]
MLKSLEITKLFRRFDYNLSFKAEGIMIITGPNGYGKSTILRILNNLCNDSFEKVLSYSFETLTIVCENDNGEPRLKITKDENEFKINDYAFPYPKNNLSRRLDFSSFMGQITINDLSEHWNFFREDTVEQRFVSSILDTLSEKRLSSNKFQSERKKLNTAMGLIKDIQKSIGNVHFIQEQRLIEKRMIPEDEQRSSRSRVKYVTVINENSEKLKAELAEIMKKHSSLSSNLDSTYIKRLFETNKNKQLPADILAGLKEIQGKQEKLQKYGLAKIQDALNMDNLAEDKLQRFGIELSIYLGDANKKYEVFESIINKLDIYERIVNEKLTFKKMKLSSTDGIVVETDDGKPLSLNDLSSGEQEILVLFYKLIFESDVNLLLIDEPEISLHIAWQKELMENLKSVVDLKENIRVVVATHSPQIITNNWNLQIDLGELYNG